MPTHDPELAALAARLTQRRPAVLKAWRDAVLADKTLTAGASLPRRQLHDHIPALLADFERRIRALSEGVPASSPEPLQDAQAHGLHRWQQGFDLAEVARELGRLNECVVAETDDIGRQQPGLGAATLATARREWAQLLGLAVSASTSQFDRLRQVEASNQMQDLERALSGLRELERQRAQLWQEAAHDLRGNLGVVANASAGLASPRASPAMRDDFLRLLDRNVQALHRLLDDVTALARLQGGHEQRRVAPMDAAVLVLELCEALRPQTLERKLELRTAGPESLPVEGDAVKVRRVVQNLVLNAVKYTRSGHVTVTWGADPAPDAQRWFVSVRDTGPGLPPAAASPLAAQLAAATRQARAAPAAAVADPADAVQPADARVPPATEASLAVRAGEGIGLAIVKRLCELLDATLELESAAGVGTTFRILLPNNYGRGAAAAP